MSITGPTVEGIHAAKRAFDKYEPRRLFYRVAKDLVELALQGRTDFSVGEALAVLLQTWNQAYYRFRRFDQAHFAAIERLLADHRDEILLFRARQISSLSEADRTGIQNLFKEFELLLGAVGAAKSLHLLAPGFFPLWDRTIANAYRCPIQQRGRNSLGYVEFMFITQRQCARLIHDKDFARNPLKALDEFNYCQFTKKWI
jgi:hypothetical protein